MKNITKCLLIALIFLGNSCGITDLEGNLENPNEVGVGSLDPDLLMNKIQLDFSQFITDANDPAMELSRMRALTGGVTYENAYQPQAFNAVWDDAYQTVLIQIETLLKRTDNSAFNIHSGVARVLKGYVYLTLVDMFGDVPYSEALKGSEGSFNPKADDGKSVYTGAITTLDEAIVLLGKPNSAALNRDVYYGGSAAKWIALANTLKLKAYLNLRLTDKATATAKVTELLAANIIDTDAEEFVYGFGVANNPPRSRHPLYRRSYQPQAGAAADYINNYFLWSCFNQKGVQDPRWRFYFSRQIGNIDVALDDDPKSVPCVISPRPSHYGANQAFCSVEPGFFGRDHGNADGIPPDQKARTLYGVYPAGGRLDTVSLTNAKFLGLGQQGQGANGAGIHPIWMAFYTDFLKAEASITLGIDPAKAQQHLEAGVTNSIKRVKAFAAAKGQNLSAALLPSEAAYMTKIGELYTAATTEDAKMNVFAKEYLIALWGNGIEAYNMYRRTGKPGDVQPMRAPTPGSFVRSFLYPADFISLNSSAKAKTPGAVNKVFWDNNPDSMFK
jgi:Starch-binding associating with outer membrane/Susd and RagB outer membrane lipoprotein